MAAYNIYEAKTKFSALVEKAEQGEEVVISRSGKPVAKLIPFELPDALPKHAPKRKRPTSVPHDIDIAGLLTALDEPWNEEEQRAFGMID